MVEFNDDRAVVIIGSGAGGGTLAYELTRQGIDEGDTVLWDGTALRKA